MISTGADVYLNINGLNDIRRQSRKDEKQALREVAQQFESIFMKMMLKSMRDASFGDPMFDSESGSFYRDMYDDQLVMELSKNGSVGLANVLVEQLGRYLPAADKKEAKTTPVVTSSAVATANQLHVTQRRAVAAAEQGRDNMVEPPVAMFDVTAANVSEPVAAEQSPQLKPISPTIDFNAGDPESFVKNLYPLAQRSAAELGVKPEVLLAQAALETGWGGAVVRNADGSSSNNLFNIKADSRWGGGSAQVATLEYRDGIARKEQARFRSYDSYEQSFADYANLIKNSPRYSEAVKHAGDSHRYVEELQQAGYATDPRYAEKIKAIMQRQTLAPTQLADASAQSE
ncbi:MAG: flagellar assembly peptidoglycan hydrolase FlgJ [Gammaproteobacteria bacterium]|nr:flagellar assembly peptidoglycan hydrolase FlgJ [Gammaproteobacteria bacterium]